MDADGGSSVISVKGTSAGDVESVQLNPGWHFTIVTSAFTMGIVFAPYTMSAGGWVWGSVFWLYSILTTWWSGVLIGRCVLDGAKRGVASTYPDMMADAFGRPGYYFTIIMQIATYFMMVCALVVNAANWLMLAWQIAGGSAGLCLWEWILVVGAIVTLLSQIRSFREVLPLAVLSLAATLARQVILYYQAGSMDLLTQCEPSYGNVSLRSAVNSLSTTALLFGGHGTFPEQIREMRRPESYYGALHAAYIICIVLYLSCAYFAYYVWGDWAAGDIQFNWPLNRATLVSALLSSVWVFIEVAMGHVMVLDLLERTILRPEELVELAPKGLKPPQWLVRTTLRSAFVWCEVIIAFMFASAGIADLQSLVGALGFTALTYYAPFAAYWQLIARRSEPIWLQLCYALAFLSGVAVMVIGVYFASVGIAQGIAEYSFFDTTTCRTSDIVDLASCSNPCLKAYGYSDAACHA